MKLRYHADAPNYDDHKQTIDLLYTISDQYGTTVEIERVNDWYRSIQVSPGDIRENPAGDIYDRDFYYNRTLGSNIDESPSQAFKAGGRHVGIIDDGLVCATTYPGDPIGYGAEVDAADTTLEFLDQVASHGPKAIEEKYMDEDEHERTDIEQFLAADVVDGTVHRGVVVGTSQLPEPFVHGANSSVGKIITRTVDAIIETDKSDWIVQRVKIFEAAAFDTALGQVIVHDRLYRLDMGKNTDTTLAIAFNTVPWRLDISAVPATVDQLTTISDKPDVRVFVGRDGEFKEITE